MRPQSAIQLQSHKRVNFNQQFGYFYVLNEQGKQLKVNKMGQLTPKFVSNFTGFYNFKERKNRALKDKSLMYSQPELKYNKQKSYICPKGSKLMGYAQYPYDLKGNFPEFFDQNTYKQSYEIRHPKSLLKKSNFLSILQQPKNNSTKNTQAFDNNKSLKTLKGQKVNFMSFDQTKENYTDSFIKEINIKKTHRSTFQQKEKHKSVILEAGEAFSGQNTLKKSNSKSKSSFNSTNASSDFIRSPKQKTRTSYFEQSLSNIQRTQTPNFVYPNPFSNENMSMSSISKFYETSIKSNCYKSSCRDPQYIPKKSYIQQKEEINVVGIQHYKEVLCQKRKESKLVYKLKESLKIYQPVIVQPTLNQTTNQELKNGAKDKNKQVPVSGLKKLSKK